MSELKLTEYQQALLNKYVIGNWTVKIGEKTIVTVIKVLNGFEIVGTSACANPSDFVFEIGEHYALVDALGKLDGYIGFMRQQENHDLATGGYVSEEIVDKLTKESTIISSAKISLTNDIVKQINSLGEGGNVGMNINLNDLVLKQDQKDVEDIVKNIIKGLKNKGRM